MTYRLERNGLMTHEANLYLTACQIFIGTFHLTYCFYILFECRRSCNRCLLDHRLAWNLRRSCRSWRHRKCCQEVFAVRQGFAEFLVGS